MRKKTTKTQQKKRPPLKLNHQPKRVIKQIENLPRNPDGTINGKLGGRPKGAQNRITREIKEIFVEAVSSVGYDKKGRDGLLGYFMKVAETRPDLTMAMMGRILPLDANIRHEHGETPKVFSSVTEFHATLAERGIRIDLVKELFRQLTLADQSAQQIAGKTIAGEIIDAELID